MENESKKTSEVQIQTPSRETELKTFDSKKLRIKVDEGSQALKELQYHFHELERLHPEEVAKIRADHPELDKTINKADGALALIQMKYGKIDGEATKDMIEKYNFAARSVNFILGKIKRNEREKSETSGPKEIPLSGNEVTLDEKSLTPAEKVELRKFAQEMYIDMFGESYTDKLVNYANSSYADMMEIPPMLRGNLPLWMTAKEDLKDWQKIGKAPIDGIESLAAGIGHAALHPIDTTVDTAKGLYKLGELISSPKDREKIMNAGKFLWGNTSAADKIAPVISFIYTIMMAGAGVSKIQKFAAIKGLSPKMVTLMPWIARSTRGVAYTSKAEKPLIIGAMTGIALPYITLQN